MSYRDIQPGDQFGRWSVIRRAHSIRRRPSDTGVRGRVLCRCACGIEKVVWVSDLQQGAQGCTSRKCAMRWDTTQQLRADFDTWIVAWLLGAGAADRAHKEQQLPENERPREKDAE